MTWGWKYIYICMSGAGPRAVRTERGRWSKWWWTTPAPNTGLESHGGASEGLNEEWRQWKTIEDQAWILCFVCGSHPWGAATFHLCSFILLLKCIKSSPVPASFFPDHWPCYIYIYKYNVFFYWITSLILFSLYIYTKKHLSYLDIFIHLILIQLILVSPLSDYVCSKTFRAQFSQGLEKRHISKHGDRVRAIVCNQFPWKKEAPVRLDPWWPISQHEYRPPHWPAMRWTQDPLVNPTTQFLASRKTQGTESNTVHPRVILLD